LEGEEFEVSLELLEVCVEVSFERRRGQGNACAVRLLVEGRDGQLQRDTACVGHGHVRHQRKESALSWQRQIAKTDEDYARQLSCGVPNGLTYGGPNQPADTAQTPAPSGACSYSRQRRPWSIMLPSGATVHAIQHRGLKTTYSG